MLDRIEFLLGEGLAALRRNTLMTVASVSTAAVALFLLGGMGYAYFRVRDYADHLSSRFTMRAFVKDGTNYEGIKETAAQIRAIPGVAEATWIPRARAWQLETQRNPDLTKGLENPYPDAFKIRLHDLSQTPSIIAAIESLPTISPEEGVQYLEGEQQLLSQATGFIRWIGLAVGGLCLITAGILIYNTIRLTVIARRRELRVMQLVGASFATIRVPFLIEGAVQGILGGLVATLLMLGAQLWVGRLLSGYASLGQPGAFPFWTSLMALGAVGFAFGVFCSLLAVRDPLRLGATGP
jgi:cell division transport system permease protein